MEVQPLISYRNVELHRREVIVLRNVNFDINPGELVYLTGRVGAGKSTLLKPLYAETPIAAGSAVVLGQDMTTLERRDVPWLRRRIGFVFQDFQLLPDRSAGDNLRFVLEATGWTDSEEINERISQVLTEMGLARKAYKAPHELSGGEQQRLVIARALLNHPQLIIADEPTGNLDSETASQIMGRLHHLAQGGTAVIVATHNQSLIQAFPSRILRCDAKTLISSTD